MATNFDDVGDFHRKFDLPAFPENNTPSLLDEKTYEFRWKFMLEELTEYRTAYDRGDLAAAADSLIDLVYVALGTAHMMGLPWQELWDEVQQANMSKVRATTTEQSARGSVLDVVKPKGWVGPNIQGVLFKWPPATA